ncbi:MAG: SBBP repeat-containing protein [Aureispira sp.]
MKLFILLFLLAGALNAQKSNDLTQAKTFAAQQKVFFEENKGQVWGADKKTATDVQYHYQQKEVDIFMLSTGLAYQFTQVHYPEGYKASSKEPLTKEQEALRAEIQVETYRMDMELVGSNPHPIIVTDGKSQDYVQYYNRNVVDVHSFQKLTYKDVYPGIDWVIYTTEKGLKYDFIVEPGADPQQIKLKFNHHEDLKINTDGSFTVANRMGSVTEQAPVSFQNKEEIKTAFKLKEDIISFELTTYDKSKSLTIDPSLVWATYYGGAGRDQGTSCAVDRSGQVYLAGYTNSSFDIALGGYQNTYGGTADAFIVKFTPSGSRVWATYYGGTNWDSGNSCTVDINGQVYLIGETTSTTNIALGGHQNTYGNGFHDAFIVKFTSTGTRLWGSYYGGNGDEYGNSCAVDGTGNVYMVGQTTSTTNIASGGFQNTYGGGTHDAFIVKFNSMGTRLWGSYYGGNAYERGLSCMVDSSEQVYLAGYTNSSVGIASGGHQNTYGGGNQDAFLVKISPSGSRVWATYYGGSTWDYGIACTIDGKGNIYLVGYTASMTNIASRGHQNAYGGGDYDAFIVKFDSTGTRLWGSYYGGTRSDLGIFCRVDGSGNVYLVGDTRSSTNIAYGGFQNAYGGGFYDGYLVKFDSIGVRQWASYYGGMDKDYGNFCVLDGSGNLYLGGSTESTTSIASGGYQNNYGGGAYDSYLAKISNKGCLNTTSTDVQIACDRYMWLDGNTYTASNNTATFTLPNASGCDSVVTLDLTIHTADTTTLVTGITITSNAIGASYQWLDCNNNFSPITSAVGQTFTPAQNGDYAVMVIENGCVDTSACVSVVVIGVNLLANKGAIHIYPNPTKGMVYLDLGTLEQVSIRVYRVDGTLMEYEVAAQGDLYSLKLPEMAGVYTLEIKTNQGNSSYKVIKK